MRVWWGPFFNTSRRGTLLYFSSLILIAHYLAPSECPARSTIQKSCITLLLFSATMESGHDVPFDWMPAFLMEWWLSWTEGVLIWELEGKQKGYFYSWTHGPCFTTTANRYGLTEIWEFLPGAWRNIPIWEFGLTKTWCYWVLMGGLSGTIYHSTKLSWRWNSSVMPLT